MLLVVGLGNPGREYERNRHNVGFMVVDELAELVEADRFKKKFSSELVKVELSPKRGAEQDGLLLKPQTFMNLSGDAVQPCAAFFKIPTESVIVIHDELDVPFGELRLKKGGGHGGHNGLRSIIGRMGPDFVRLRFGIGRPPASFRGAPADFVLSDFAGNERDELPKLVEKAAKVVLSIATRGLQAAMKTTNTRPKKNKPPKPPEAPPREDAPEAERD